MKNHYIIILLFTILFISKPSFADEAIDLQKFFSADSSVPAKTMSNEPQRTLNKTVIKAQISSIKSKIVNTNSLYELSTYNLVINMLPSVQLEMYNKERNNIKNKPNAISIFNNDAAEYSTNCLNKFLKSYDAKDSFQNLTIAQRVAVKRNLLNLKYTCGSYVQITDQIKALIKQIKADKSVALELKADINDLSKMQNSVARQNKSVNKLINDIANVAAKYGLAL